MNESASSHGQLDKDSATQIGYDYTSIKPVALKESTTVRISNIVTCCPQGEGNSILTTSAYEGKQEELRIFYQSYDPRVGLHTAAVLGGILVILILYLFYKTKCKKAIKKGFIYLRDHTGDKKKFEKLDQPPTAQEMPNITRLMAKTGTWIRIDSPEVLPTMEVDSLEATAQWVQNHPVEFQGLHDVTGLILKIDTDLIQARDNEHHVFPGSRSEFMLKQAQRTDSVDSLRKTMLAHNHLGIEQSNRTYLAVPPIGCAWGNNLIAGCGSSSYPNIRQLYYAPDTWKLPVPQKSTDSNPTTSHHIPVRICNSGNIQIHRTKSDDLSSGITDHNEGNSNSETSDDSEMCVEPLLQQVIVEPTPPTEQYFWPANTPNGDDKIQADCFNADVNQPLSDLQNCTISGSQEVGAKADTITNKMETML